MAEMKSGRSRYTDLYGSYGPLLSFYHMYIPEKSYRKADKIACIKNCRIHLIAGGVKEDWKSFVDKSGATSGSLARVLPVLSCDREVIRLLSERLTLEPFSLTGLKRTFFVFEQQFSHMKRRGMYRVRRVFFFLVNRVEHQKRTQTATKWWPFGLVFGVQLGSLEKRNAAYAVHAAPLYMLTTNGTLAKRRYDVKAGKYNEFLYVLLHGYAISIYGINFAFFSRLPAPIFTNAILRSLYFSQTLLKIFSIGGPNFHRWETKAINLRSFFPLKQHCP